MNTPAQTLVQNFIDQGLTLAVAESCTGGLISSMITQIPGASHMFERGFITYSDNAKIEMLGVTKSTLLIHGAVSAQTALEMAQGVLQHSHANIAASVTGIAGPAGGTKDKPTGLVYFGVTQEGKPPQSIKKIFQGTRIEIQAQATDFLLNVLIEKTNSND